MNGNGTFTVKNLADRLRVDILHTYRDSDDHLICLVNREGLDFFASHGFSVKDEPPTERRKTAAIIPPDWVNRNRQKLLSALTDGCEIVYLKGKMKRRAKRFNSYGAKMSQIRGWKIYPVTAVRFDTVADQDFFMSTWSHDSWLTSQVYDDDGELVDKFSDG